jgi:hypothetical protein
MYWHLTPQQLSLFIQTVEGQSFVDLGAGDGSLAIKALDNDALQATALECRQENGQQRHPRLKWVHQTFRDAETRQYPLALLSWPWEGNQTDALIRHLTSCRQILVIGKTTGGSACGTAKLWKFLSGLKVQDCIPDPRNTLVLYRNQPRQGYKSRRTAETHLLCLEAAGMDEVIPHPYREDIWVPTSEIPEITSPWKDPE